MSRSAAAGEARIPVWRNVKTIGVLAQVVFVAVLLAGALLLAMNVRSALASANLPADFRWWGSRAGIPIAETPIPYTTEDSYGRALFIGLLNTLKVALIGVVLATVIGIGVGVMRLAKNWLVRTIATVYIELLRNVPLAVQIVFWYTAVLLPVPPRVNNPIELPGGVLLSNVGLAFPFLYPGDRFGAWWPWVVVALVAAVGGALWRVRAARTADRPLRVWPVPLALLIGISAVGYGVAALDRSLPPELTIDFDVERGRGSVFFDADGDGRRGPSERVAPFASTIVRVPTGELTASTQNLTESRRVVPATFRFPLVREGDVAEVEVGFVDVDAAA